MALDGTLLRQIKHELEGCLLNARVDKIHQISREEMVFILRLPQPSPDFHSFCKATRISAVAFQSVLSFNASAFSHNAFFFSRFSAILSLTALKYSAFFAKNSSQLLRNLSNN